MPSENSATTIPIVDFSAWSSNTQDPEGRLRAAQELVDACKKVGFVYIINHSLPEKVLDGAFDYAKRFFSLPEEDKMKVPHPEGWAVHRGYSWPGLEKISHVDVGDDEDKLKELKQVPDVKVSIGTCPGRCHPAITRHHKL